MIRELTMQEVDLIHDSYKEKVEREPEPCDVYDDCLFCPNYMTVGGCGEA